MYGLEATLIAHLRENEAALLKDNSDSSSTGSGMLSCDYSDWSNILQPAPGSGHLTGT